MPPKAAASPRFTAPETAPTSRADAATQDPAHLRIDHGREPAAEGTGDAMVGQRGDGHAGEYRQRTTETGGEQKGEQLGLVADFRQGNGDG